MSAPMNMEEWQRKLKAEKDAARQKKSESAEILHGYRGDIKDDELKLKMIRDEERKKAYDAQQILHNYKGGSSTQLPDGATTTGKSKEQRTEQHFPTPVNAGQGPHRDDVLEAIVQGSVSERAAALAAAAEGASSIPTPVAAVSSTHLASRTSATTDDVVNEPAPTTADDDDDDDDDYGPSLQPNSNAPIVNNSSAELQQPPSTLPNNNTIISTTTDSALIADEIRPPLVTTTPIEESVMVEKPPEILESNGLPSLSSPNVEDIIPNPQPQRKRMDVLLAFGLVTISSPPNLESYMKAVQTIASTSIQQNSKVGSDDATTIMDPNIPPYVKDTKWDASYASRSGRVDVKRLLVTVAVPVFVPGNASKESNTKIKDMIANTLQTAITSGDFLSHARN